MSHFRIYQKLARVATEVEDLPILLAGLYD